MGSRSLFDQADEVLAAGGDRGTPEMSGGVVSSYAEVGNQPFFHLKPSQCFFKTVGLSAWSRATTFLSLYAHHRFDLPVQKGVSFLLDQALFDLPRSDGRQLKASYILLLHMRPSLRSDIATNDIGLMKALAHQRQMNYMIRQKVSKKRLRTTGLVRVRRCGNSFSFSPAGLLQLLCFKPSH